MQFRTLDNMLNYSKMRKYTQGLILCTLLILCALVGVVLYSSEKSNVLLEFIQRNLTKTKQEATILIKENPILILREEYKFTFPAIDVTEEPVGNGTHKRVKRQTTGLLKAKDIHAKNIETEKMFARKVQADIVRASKVNAIVISIGKAFSMHKSSNHGKPDTLVLNRDGPDPTDSSVTIVLEREGEPVSINGHPSDKEDKRKLITMKNFIVKKKNSTKIKKPKLQSRKIVLPKLNNRLPIAQFRSFIRKPRARLIIRPALPTHRTINSLLKPTKKPELVKRKILTTAKVPTPTRSTVNEVKKKQLLMEHWRKKILNYQKRRNVKPLIVTRNKVVSPLRPSPFPVRLRSPTPKMVKPFIAIPVRLRTQPLPSFVRPARPPMRRLLPLPLYRRHNMLVKPRQSIPTAKIKPVSKSDEISDMDSNDWDDDDKIDIKPNLAMKTFERVRPSFDDSDDEAWYNSDEYYNDSIYDDDEFSDEIEGGNRQRKPVRKGRNHRNNFDEYSYDTDQSYEFDYYSDESSDKNSMRGTDKLISKAINAKEKRKPHADDDSYSDKDDRGKGRLRKDTESSEDYFSSEYELYSDESEIKTKRPIKSLDSIQSTKKRNKSMFDSKEPKEKTKLITITDKQDVQRQKIRKLALLSPIKSQSSLGKVPIRKLKSASKIATSGLPKRISSVKLFEDFYTESDESDSVVSIENSDEIRKEFFSESAEEWFNSEGEWDLSSEFDSFEKADKRLQNKLLPQAKLLTWLIK